MPWRPGRRRADLALEEPYEDVPDHLRVPLWSWVTGRLTRPVLFAMGVRMRFEMPDPRQGTSEYAAVMQAVSERVQSEPVFLLDIVEFLLETGMAQTGGFESAHELNQLLGDANSIYCLREDWQGLEVRVVPEVRDAVQAVVDQAEGSPGNHLAAAWSAAYGRTPDPVKAYSEAIKSAEAAAAPVVSPQNLKATLGTMNRDLKAKPSKWDFAISAAGDGGVEEVQRMMALLWEGQTSRHGGVGPTVPESPEAARAAVHLAATLVQFFVGRIFTSR